MFSPVIIIENNLFYFVTRHPVSVVSVWCDVVSPHKHCDTVLDTLVVHQHWSLQLHRCQISISDVPWCHEKVLLSQYSHIMLVLCYSTRVQVWHVGCTTRAMWDVSHGHLISFSHQFVTCLSMTEEIWMCAVITIKIGLNIEQRELVSNWRSVNFLWVDLIKSVQSESKFYRAAFKQDSDWNYF